MLLYIYVSVCTVYAMLVYTYNVHGSSGYMYLCGQMRYTTTMSVHIKYVYGRLNALYTNI
jgi:hypothetical protein